MKQTSLKVLRGRLEQAINEHTRAIRTEYEQARSARMKRNEAAALKVHADIVKAVEKRPSDYVEITVQPPTAYNDGLDVRVSTTEKYDALTKALREKHGYDRSCEQMEGKTLVCYALGIGEDSRRNRWHNSVYVATYEKFQPLLTKIDDEFLKTDPSDISAMIDAFLA